MSTTEGGGVRAGQDALFRALEDGDARLTPSERAIAAWLRDNIDAVPFNTGTQMAAAIGVSEMTLIRFLRNMGYANLRHLKDQLRPAPSPDLARLDDVAVRFTSKSADVGSLAKSRLWKLAGRGHTLASCRTKRSGSV